MFDDILVANRAFGKSTWVNDKRHSWKEWRYGHSSLAVDGKLDNSLPNCAIMDNYYVDKPVWMVDLGKSNTKVNGVIVYTWQGAGQGRLIIIIFYICINIIINKNQNIQYYIN